MHRAGKINAVENLDLVPLFLLEEIPHLGQNPALGVHHHIGAVSLEKLGGEPEAGFAGAGGADHTGVEVPGIGGVLGPGVGGEKFRPGENNIFLKLGIDERGNIFFRSPSGGAVFLVPAILFRVLGLDIDEQPDRRRPRDPHQPVHRVQPRGGGGKGRVDRAHHAHQLLADVGASRQPVGRPQLQAAPGHEQVGQVGEEVFFQTTFLHARPPLPVLFGAVAAAAPRPASSAPEWERAAPWAGPAPGGSIPRNRR